MYRITRALSIGRFVTPERAELLRAGGVTHILNVSDSPSVVSPSGTFRAVEWIPVEDQTILAAERLVQLLEALHAMTLEPDSHVFVHCIAGHLRSPTVLWLYLIACGVSPSEARVWIECGSPDASPGATRMIDESHIRFAQQHGLANFQPHPRAEVLVRFEADADRS